MLENILLYLAARGPTLGLQKAKRIFPAAKETMVSHLCL
jgi:hypothetical protein